MIACMTEMRTIESREAEHAFGELDTSQVLRLFARHHLGRLAFAYESWPVILPVNYVLDDTTIVIRTAPGAKLASTPFHAAAFEVDAVDPEGSWGWSVLAQGPAFDITNAVDDRSTYLRSLVIQSPTPGLRRHWLTISAIRLSGRYFGKLPDGILSI